MKKILLLSFVILLNSCVASLQTVSLNHREYDGLSEGVLHKDLGDPLIVQGIENYSKGVKIESGINEIVKKQMGYVWDVNLRGGEVLYFGGKDKTKDFYLSEKEKTLANNKYKQGVAINRKTKQKYVAVVQGTYLLIKPFDFNYSEKEYKSNISRI